jgi:colanic acid biosynthesis glycosyl transferase WcaI
MRRRVIAKGVPAGKVTLIPNFVDTGTVLAVARPNPFSRRHQLDDLFVVSYAGNVGPAQGLEALIDAAAALRDLPHVRVVVVGGGILWEALAQRIATERIDNILLLPHQPFDAVPDIYGSSDLCVVAQSATTTSDAVPSKVYRIMGAGKPVLAMTAPGSDLAALVADAGCGVVVSAADPAAIAGAIRDAAAAPGRCRAMGEAGRAHVEAHYSRRAVTARYNALVNELTAESR